MAARRKFTEAAADMVIMKDPKAKEKLGKAYYKATKDKKVPVLKTISQTDKERAAIEAEKERRRKEDEKEYYKAIKNRKVEDLKGISPSDKERETLRKDEEHRKKEAEKARKANVLHGTVIGKNGKEIKPDSSPRARLRKLLAKEAVQQGEE